MISQRTLRVIHRRWVSIVLVTLVSALLGVGYALSAPVAYTSSASTFFSLTTGSSASDLVQGSTYAQNQVQSFALLATTPAVLEPVASQLAVPGGADALAGQIQAQVPVGTVIVRISVTDRSAQNSARLANAVVASLSHVVEGIAPKDANGHATVVATTVAPAQTPRSPSAPDVPLILVAAIIAGLVVGGGQAWAREAVDTRVRDAEDLAEITGMPFLGSIGTWTARDQDPVVVASAPFSSPSESFRQLRTNLTFLRIANEPVEGAQVLSITSSLAGEGKSTVSSNLAVALAQTGARVLLVDADMRRPTIAGLLRLEGGVGLTTVLAGEARLVHVVQRWGEHGLHVLPSGPLPPNPAELLGSPVMRRLVEQLRRNYDYVVFDSPPLLPVADAVVLSRVVDGTVVVAQAGRVRRGQVVHALANLEQVSAPVVGLVLNQVRQDAGTYDYEGLEAPAPPETPVPAARQGERGRRITVS